MRRLRAGLFLGAALLLLLVAIPARAHVGTGVVVDAEGRVYFTDPLRNRLSRLRGDAPLALPGGGAARPPCVSPWAWARGATLGVRDGKRFRRVAPDGTVTPVPGGAEAGAA